MGHCQLLFLLYLLLFYYLIREIGFAELEVRSSVVSLIRSN